MIRTLNPAELAAALLPATSDSVSKCRLIPLAIGCICEATMRQSTFQHMLKSSVARCRDLSGQSLAELYELQFSCLDAVLKAVPGGNHQPRPYQALATALMGQKLSSSSIPWHHNFAALQASAGCIMQKRGVVEPQNPFDWLYPDQNHEADSAVQSKQLTTDDVACSNASSAANWPMPTVAFVALAFAAGFVAGLTAKTSAARSSV